MIGLAAVGLALAWSEAHPPRPMLVVAGPLVFRPGTAPPGSYGRHPWEVRNAGLLALKLRVYFTGGHSGFSLWQGQEHVIPPGERIVVHLTWSTPVDEGRAFSSHVVLRTNDPERPEFRLRVVGTSGLLGFPNPPSLPETSAGRDRPVSPLPVGRR